MAKPRVRLQKSNIVASDLGTDQLAERQRTVILKSADGARQRRVLAQIPIDYYRALNVKRKGAGITPRQHEAGERLYETFCESSLSPAPKPLWEKVSITTTVQSYASERIAQAMQTWRNIMSLMDEDDFGTKLVINVCCYGFLLKDLQGQYFRTGSSLMDRLREALDKLAKSYGIPK